MSQDSNGENPKKLSLSGSKLTLGGVDAGRMRAGGVGVRTRVMVEVRRKRAPVAPHRVRPAEPVSPQKMKKPVPWTVDSHTKHPETEMWHDRVGWDNPKSESRFRVGENITKKEIALNKEIAAADCKTVEEVMGLIPNLRRIGHSSRLKADMNRLFEYARGDTWSKHVFNESFISKRPDGGGKWTRHMRPMGAKVLVRFLVHVGPEFYIDGDIDLRALREYASSADVFEEPPASNDNKVTPVKITESRQQTVTTRPYDTGKFRKQMLAKNPVCPVTGIDRPQFLRVSHIKADSASEAEGKHYERTDEANVLMLSLAADELFDGICPRGFTGWKGRAAWITFADDGKLMRSLHMTGDELHRFGISHHVSIAHLLKGRAGDRRREYLRWHRENMFLDNNKKEDSDG